MMPWRSPADRRRVLVDLTPAGQAVLDPVLPEVQQLVTAAMGPLDDQAFHTLVDHLTVVRQAITAAPTDLPPPAPRRTPLQLRLAIRGCGRASRPRPSHSP